MPPRIPPPDPDDLDPEVAVTLSVALAPSGEPAATMAVLAHQGELLGPFLGWAAALHLNGVLSGRQHEILALRAADELHATSDISDASWRALSAEHDEAALAEIIFVVGQYTMLSMVANAARVEMPEGLDPMPEGSR